MGETSEPAPQGVHKTGQLNRIPGSVDPGHPIEAIEGRPGFYSRASEDGL